MDLEKVLDKIQEAFVIKQISDKVAIEGSFVYLI